MTIGADQALVIWNEDFNNINNDEDFNNINNDDDFFPSAASGNWDLVVSHADGSGEDQVMNLPGNQFLLSTFHSGSRVTFDGQVGADPLNIHGYVANFETSTGVTGAPIGNDGVQTTTEVTTADGSGTAVVLPPATIATFPPGEPHEVQITTPISPVSEAQLPSDAAVDAIPVVRDFGPSGTTFNPPIGVTIHYTDADIAGLDESTLHPYLFNENTQVFDTPVAEEDIIERDLEANSITFRVSHFSNYGLGAQQLTLSARGWELYQ